MKKYINKWLVVFGLMLGSGAWAQSASATDTKSDMLIYIQPVEFTNPIKLWHPYSDYWFYQGPIVESLAVDKLGQAYGQVSICDANQFGRALVWLQPKMFYNPQVQLFYGKVTAEVYTGIGEHIATYIGESSVHGLIGASAESWIKQSYALAIDNVIGKMQADHALQALMSSKAKSDTGATPCSMVTLLPTTKIRAMPF